MEQNHPENRFERHERPSALPLWIASAVLLICACFFPLYKWYHYLLCAAIAFAAWLIASRLCPPIVEYVELPVTTGDDDADQLIADIEKALVSIRAAQEIADGTEKDDIQEIIEALEKISGEIVRSPQKSAKLRKFRSYYLPTISKLCDKYVHFADSGDAARLSADEIGDAFGTIARAMQRQLDAIMADDILDISTDIDVLEKMVSGDGLSDK